jgi:hypothetical protein
LKDKRTGSSPELVRLFSYITFYPPTMKQLLLFLAITLLLAGCSDKDGTADSTDSTSITTPIDTSLNTTSTQVDKYDFGDPYTNSEIINKPGTVTLITTISEMYSDTLLQIPLQILAVGEYVLIEKYCGRTTKNYWDEPFYEVTYYDSDQKKTHGYVSQSQIACSLDTLKSKKIVALTLDYSLSKEKFIGKILLLNQIRKTLATNSVELDIPKEGDAPYSYSYYFSFEEIESTGLDGITESFSISTDYGACGYPGFGYTFLWNEKKLITCPETYAVADADVFFACSYLVFPSDSLGRKSYIMNIIEEQESIDSPSHDSDKAYYKKDSTVITFKWNKSSYSIDKGDTIVKTSRTFADSNQD